MTRLIYILFPTCFSFLLNAQSELRISEWRAFLPHQYGNTVTQDEDDVFYGSGNGILKINKDTRDASFFTKVDGLSDVGIHLVKYHAPTDVLIVAYENSGIDLVFGDRVVFVDDIRTNSGILGSKAINDIYTDTSDKIYLSCAFGLVEFDVRTLKFGFTTFTPASVNMFTKFQNAFYIATEEGIYLFDEFDTQLPANFDAWQLLGEAEGLPSAEYASEAIAVYQNVLFAGIGDGVYRYDGGFYLWAAREDHYVSFISAEGAHMKVGFRCPNNSCNGKVHFYTLDGLISEHGFECTGQPTYAIEDSDGQVWYADEDPGIRFATAYNAPCENLMFNAPASDKVSEMALHEGTLFVATGGVSDSYNALGRREGFLVRENGEWTQYFHANVPELAQNGVQDYFRVIAHPDGSRVYVGSYFAGLVEYDFESFVVYNQENSILGGAVGDPLRERIAGLAFDPEGNLWMSNYLAEKPIVVKKADGTWKNFNVPGNTELGQVVVDQRGYKWFAVISISEGVLVFDDNRTIDNTADDRYKYFNTSNSALPINLLSTLAVDREGDIWVGTREGPVTFDGAQDPFSGEGHGYRVKVEQEGIISYLLFEEEITAIAIDGANRKWFGTKTGGVFVQSPDGESQIALYNTENSPLLNNAITDIVIDPANGDVYIGTESGINVVRTDAIAGTELHRRDVYAFPNPVRPEYDGPIAVRGLAEDAIVKITDIHGSLIFESQALGGQAIWNGRDLKGQRAATGVYLVFSSTESQFDKPDAIVTKILFVK
jgi:ligand-binding sensor domain-containing protein